MRLWPWPEERVSRVRWGSIRQLLCSDPACTVCEHAADEASQHTAAAGRPGSRRPVEPELDRPGRKSHRKFPRSASAPAPTSAPFGLRPARPANCSSSLGPPGVERDQSLPCEELAALDWNERSHPSSHRGETEVLASSSSTYSASHFTWTKSSSGLSELSLGSLTLSRSISQLQVALTEQEDSQGSSWTASKASSEPQTGQRGRRLAPQERPCFQTSPPRTAARSPAGAGKDRETEFTRAKAPFLEDAVVASLESHVLVKRVQHHLGLPVTLLRSLRSFMLPAPDLTPRRRRREFGVATRPQALPFVGSGTRKKLEQHLTKMVRLKRWQLPQRIQGALGQIKGPPRPREKKPPSAGRKRGPGVTGQVKGTRRPPTTSAELPTTPGVLGSKTTLASQAELQSHLVKKSLEIRLETFPAIVGHSQKVSSRLRVPRLPKSIPLGQSFPQLRNRLCLVLRSKADAVEMNIKCKYLHFLWGIPSLYMQSLRKMVPRAPGDPTAPSRMHATIEFVSMKPPFVEIWSLEYHVLKKRLQHQWGLPGLVLRSMKQFLVPLPPLPARAGSVRGSCLEVKVLIGDTLFLLTHLAIKEKLETHVKTKIIERRWGLPRRALDSLRVFIPVTPPLVKRAKGNEKTFALPRGEKLAKRKPSTRAPRTSKKLMDSSGKALQRHLTKKALEVRLGAIAPVAQRSQAAVRRAWKKDTLPRVIPPGLKPPALRRQELLFVAPSALGNLQLNIVHKSLMHRWGLLTVYHKSLARLFRDVGSPSAVALFPRKPTESKFAATKTLFVSPQSREALEWHVRRKSLQHTWGLPGLIQRSLRYLRPDAPSFWPRKGRRAGVSVSPTEPTFLSNAARRALERNVQKRILSQQWQLPRRVLQSLRLLRPTWKADALHQKPPGFPFAQGRGSCARKAGHPNHLASRITNALCTECYIKEMGGAAPPRSQGFPVLRSTNRRKLELHWTKKCVEVQLGVLPTVIKRSWKRASAMSGQRLPKPIPPGRKPPQPRKRSLPLVSQEEAGRMEVAVRLGHLMSLWGLGARYVEGLRAMIPSAPARPLRTHRRTAVEFSERQVPFLSGQAREALELHVKKKRLQRAWGVPVLVCRSVDAFAQGSPLAPAFRKTTTRIETLQQDPAFLPRGACGHLEHHLQRMKLQRQWGLPLRVLKSLRWLMPATEESEPAERAREPPRGSIPGAAISGQGKKAPPERGGAALCPTCQGSALKGAALKKLQRHLAKKSVEVRLEVLPAVPRLSWGLALLSSKPPLPKLLPPGRRVLEPRRSSFPFLRTEDLDRVEVAVRCGHLASLWGLGAQYVEAVVALAARAPFHPVKRRRAAFGLPAGKPPSFPWLDPAALELHVKKKRMQHEWGLPALALQSLGGFLPGPPALPHLSKTVIETSVLPQALSFLPRATCSLLEFHVQRMKLQLTWGLPGRILASVKAFLSSASWATSAFTLKYSEERSELVGAIPSGTQPSPGVGKMAKAGVFPCCPCFSLKQKGMEAHFRKKYLETRLEAFPTLVSLSQAAASGWGGTRLPKLVRAGQKHPAGRVVSLPFLPPAAVDLLEVNMKHKHLAFLWGLPSQHLEPLSALAPRGAPPVRFGRGKISFQEAKTPFCQKEARERLEHHIRQKRLHHHWGLPSVFQRSLRAWAPAWPADAQPRQKTSEEVNVLVADIPFVSALAQKELETSLKKMIIHGRWGLSKRLQSSLRAFVPDPLEDRELRKEGAADGGITACAPDTKRARRITRPPRGTSVGPVSRQAPLQTSVAPILGLFSSSKIRALENHLTKKSLEIKFQRPVVRVDPIKRARLPKRPPLSPVMKPRGAVLFVEPEALLKIALNIKCKYLAYLWGLPSLHAESLKKMFGTALERPQKTTVLGKEGIRKGRGAARPGKGTRKPAGFGSKSFQSPTAGLSFLMDEALNLLESHVRRKKLQHEWGLPATVQKSLRAFAPFSSDAQRSAPSSERPALRPCGIQVSVVPQSLLFLDPAERRHLEEHLRNRTAVHTWGIPKRVQQSLKRFLPPASLSPKSQDQTQSLLGRSDQIPPAAAKHPQRKAEGLPGRATSRGVSPRRGLAREAGARQPVHRAVGQPAELSPEGMHRDKKPRRGRKTPERKSLQAAKFLTGQAWDLLEFHIRRKRIQHEWGLPSLVQKSLRAFTPLPPDSRASTRPRPGAYMAAKGLRAKRTAADHASTAEVSVPFQALTFLDAEVKNHLEAHVRSRTAAHRWGLPTLVQDSLRAFLPPELHSQTPRSPSHQQQETHSEPEGRESPELLGVRHRTPEKQRRTRQRKPVATTRTRKEAAALIFSELKSPFLPEEILGLLAFHVQHKKVQRTWGLPSFALKSLHTFAPFPFETEKIPQRAGKITAEIRPWVREDVRVIITPSLSFLSPDTKQRLEAHLSNRVAKHRWGLPALVQQSLKAFLPPAPSSPSKAAQAQPLSTQPRQSFQVATTGRGHRGDSMREATPGRRKTGNRVISHQKKQATASPSPGGQLPFLTGEAQELLEFHTQRKKVQHLWGLPSTVLKSLRAFAPFPSKTEKIPQHTGKITAVIRPWVREDVRVIITPSLSFLSPDTKQGLEAHLSSMVAKRQWGLPALVQQSLKAFLPPAPSSPSKAAEAQPPSTQPRQSFHVAEASGGHRGDAKPVAMPRRRKTGKREDIRQKKQAATFSSPAGQLPFLTGEAQELLEFHTQRKKVQHLWGLPSNVLKSLRAFAPFPREPVKRAQDAAATPTKKRPWETEVRVPVQSLSFLGEGAQERLEAHVRSRTAEHRWGLPKLVQQSLGALLPPASLSHSGETNGEPPSHPRRSGSPQVPVTQPRTLTGRSARKLPGRKETSRELEKDKPVATSSAVSAVPSALSLVAKLPFLTNGKQDALEFHIQRKKIQHEWGLPLTVQRSVHAFAPVPPELHQGVPSTGGGRAAVAGGKDAVGEMGVGTKKPWDTGKVNVAVPSLHFLTPDTKENLEAHLRNLTIEHVWRLPKLVHKSMRAFIPLSSQLDLREMEGEECHSHGKILTASDDPFPPGATQEARSEDQPVYHSKPWLETERDGETDSGSATEEPLSGPGTKPEHATAIPGESGRWKAGRESPQRSTLQKRPHLKKAPQRQKSMVFDLRRDLSSSIPGPKKYRYNASSQSTNLPRARYSRGRAPVPRPSKTTLRNRKGMSQEAEYGFQRTAEGSYPRAGLKEPQSPCVSYPGWELSEVQKDPCACYLKAHRDDSGSSLPSDADQSRGKAKGTRTDSSGDPDHQDAGVSSEDSPTAGASQEQGAAPQGGVPISKEAESSLVRPAAPARSPALRKDTSAGPHAGLVRTSSSLPKRGSRLGGNWEKKKAQPRLPKLHPPARGLKRQSFEDLCEACRGQNPPLPPKDSGTPKSEAASRSRDSGELDRIRPPAPQNQGSSERNGGSQGQPEPNSQSATDDNVTDQKPEEGTGSPSKELRPPSTGVASQFSTECEWEKVGDWDTEEEGAGRRNHLRKEEGGSTRSTGEMPRMATSRKAQGSPKRAGSPAARQPQAPPKSVVLRKEEPAVVKTEKRRVFGPDREGRRTVVRMKTIRVKGPEGSKSQGARDEEEGILHWRKGPSPKGLLPAKGALARHGSSRSFRTPRGSGALEREALKMAQDFSKGVRGEDQLAQFIQGVLDQDTHRKMSLLGTIVEKKLSLRQGFRVWVQSQERGSQRRTIKSLGGSRPPTFQGTREAQMRWVEMRCYDSQGGAKPRGAGRALPAGPQQRQASKAASPTFPGYPRRPSIRRKRDMTRGRSRSRERRKWTETLWSGSKESERERLS